ncbi:putative alpha,alpha-trehalose-phosphate synthase (UDP-forming), Trehalose-phosphatase [Helianthus annuus]|nr:putative alpha,alpha-trehalose-phosphate synthase (UDP-forming), Trehalose-phosphatase [Helianthus annuus]
MADPAVSSQYDTVTSDAPSDVPNRLIVVSNQLPIIARRKTNDNGGSFWDFTWDESSIYMHIKDALPAAVEVFYVGTLRADVGPTEQDDVSKTLLDRFNCVAAFVPTSKWDQYYHCFCKQYLWPIFHYKVPASDVKSVPNSRDSWNAYVHVNKEFSQKVMEAVTNANNYVWIHDYHLMTLPTFLRRDFCRFKIGFFLHSPFPSSEVYKTLPMRNELLKGLLNADLIGFHTYDYARHFLTCCSRMFGLDHQLKRGYIFLEYNGRSIEIKIKASGIHVGRMESYLSQPDTRLQVQELKKRFEGKIVLLGVDDLDIFKGVNFKVLALEKLLKSHPSWQGRVVLVQILNPARARCQDVDEINAEIRTVCERINNELGSPGYQPVVLIDGPVSLSEKAAYYAIADMAIVTPLRDGMNLIPYEYVVSRQSVNDPNPNTPKKSMLVVSEFIGCSLSLTGAIRVNPWDELETAEALYDALMASDDHKETAHMKQYQYIISHDVANWARSFFQDLEQACIDHSRKRCMNLGFGLDTRVVLFDEKFSKLDTDVLENAYSMAQNRAILLDYDGTVTPSISKSPTEAVISMINKLCNDPKNMVFIVSGRSRENLGSWFGACEKLAIAAEHGYFIRWAGDQEWETCARENNVGWMEMAEPVMNLYTETTDGSYIEKKETAMVWHYEDADKDLGLEQAKELLDHLENVLANEPVEVKRGQYIVEVKPQGVTKGIVAEKIFAFMAEKGKQADFVLSVGDDRSDEDMFVAIGDGIKKGRITNNNSVFTCVVGEKPSAAEYFLDETKDVSMMLEKLGCLSNQG